MSDLQNTDALLITVQEAACMLGVSKVSIFKYWRDGLEFPKRIKVGGSTRIRKSDLLAWIDAQG